MRLCGHAFCGLLQLHPELRVWHGCQATPIVLSPLRRLRKPLVAGLHPCWARRGERRVSGAARFFERNVANQQVRAGTDAVHRGAIAREGPRQVLSHVLGNGLCANRALRAAAAASARRTVALKVPDLPTGVARAAPAPPCLHGRLLQRRKPVLRLRLRTSVAAAAAEGERASRLPAVAPPRRVALPAVISRHFGEGARTMEVPLPLGPFLGGSARAGAEGTNYGRHNRSFTLR